MSKHILIIGTGSAGKRHAQNLVALGCQVACVDPRADRRDELSEAVAVTGGFPSHEDALASGAAFDAAVIASPTARHAPQAIDVLQHGLPLLLEKPVAPSLADAGRVRDAARQSGTPLLLGYTWRWWPPLAELQRLIRSGAVGRPLHVRFTMSAHLADWHPWERYQDFFMSSQALGGGALLDESHWLDLMLWLFGAPAWCLGDIGTLSDLEIDVDDNVDVIAGFDGGMRVTLHLDIYGRPHEKSIVVTGEAGSLIWSEAPNRIRIGRKPEAAFEDIDFDYERNDMFMALARDFLDLVDGAGAAACTIDDGCEVLRLIEALRLSTREGRRVALTEIAD